MVRLASDNSRPQRIFQRSLLTLMPFAKNYTHQRSSESAIDSFLSPFVALEPKPLFVKYLCEVKI